MEPITTILATAAGYILKGAAQSKTADKAKEQILSTFWKWIRPKFIKEVPELENNPEAPETVAKTETHLLELVKDETFFSELQQKIAELQQAGIREKNIVKSDLSGVQRIRIGDKWYSPDEPWDKKNIVHGTVRDADEFTLGDGH